ncbi:adenylate/guanylate cyclase domain-containing protein [Rubrobacter aplysinae]|uniref:adenylate/guanylate cyclase domain-containing protein n=1 Tax=Rubrobacter aplysinae TaxID=909625 RepID=UPI00064BB697|nr:adenylate/guanylate cyclase domain-containing protein [Rubrobacter aplysinae]
MGWDYDQSIERIQRHLDNMGEIEVQKLKREADLESLLSETVCREIYGAHVYLGVSNFAALASDDTYSKDDYKRLVRSLHIYQREVSRIVERDELFGGLRVHFQGPKLHALFYRPIDDGQELASRAVLLQLVLKDFSENVFNPCFPDYEPFSIAGGADIGDVIGTKNGSKGDREMLFLGSAANRAAKIMSSSGRYRLTGDMYDVLPEDLKEVCTEVANDLYRIKPVSQDLLDELLGARELGWNREKSLARVKEDKKKLPLTDISYGSAKKLIDLDSLSIHNNKRVLAASVFADVSGFTAYVEEAETEAEHGEALRVFHVIRRELAAVVKGDYEGLRIQFQGDRIQALFHLPEDDQEGVAAEAIEAAVGLQSSMEHAIKELLPEAGDLDLAVGVDLGTTLVSKLGTRGHRDRICVGMPVENASELEERIKGGRIAITSNTYKALPANLGEHFSYDSGARCYVAYGLTMETLDLAKRKRDYESSKTARVTTGIAGALVAGAATAAWAKKKGREEKDAREIKPSPSYYGRD